MVFFVLQERTMVTAKKASTPKPVAAAAPAVAKPVAAKKPAVKQSTAPAAPIAAAPAAPVKATVAAEPKAAKTAAATSSKPALSAEQRNNYVEVAAFYIAERREFVPGNPSDDWCAAELEVDRLIASGHFN